VTTYREKTNAHFGGPVKSLIFAASVAHAADLATQFAAVGLNFCAISYKDDEDFKADVHAEFEKPESSIIGLIAVDMLTKGFDVAAIKCAVMARPFSKSVASIIQQVGREMRTAPGKDAAILIDHAGNFLRHGEQIFDIFENGITELDDGAEKTAKEKTIKEKEACKCPKCSALWRGATDTCGQCGYVRPSRSKVQQVAGQVSEFVRAAIAKTERQDFYSQLLGLAQSRDYSPGWAAHKFKEKFEVFPDGLKKTPTPCGPKVAAYVKSRSIAAWRRSA
jgi:DNA repair protein RadD